MKKISVIIACLLVAGMATFAAADPRGSGCGRGYGGGWGCKISPSDMASLDLTAEQTEKIRVLKESCLKFFAPIRTQMFTKKAELKLQWMQINPDADKIRATQKEILGLIGQIQDKRTDCRLAFREILTPEQSSKLLALGLGSGCGKEKRKKGARGRGKRDRGQP